jgi:hypothetical protein
MAKYLVLWHVDQNRIPMDPKERGKNFGFALDLVKQDLKKGSFTDWGHYYGGNYGYLTSTLAEVELEKALQKYSPLIIFEVHPVTSADTAAEVAKWLTTL